MRVDRKLVASLCLSLSVAIIGGCASHGVENPGGSRVVEMRPDEKGFVQGTGIESQDIVLVADKMARGLMTVPEIAKATTPPRIVMLPVKNDTRFPFNKDIFLDEIMALLNDRAAGKVRFLARDRISDLERERDLKRTGQVTSNGDPNIQQFKGADLILTGKLVGETTRTSAGTSDYVLYSFELINPNTSEIIWNGSHRIKKQGQTDAAYR